MQDRPIPISIGKLVTFSLWTLVALLLLGAWIAWLAGASSELPLLLALTGCTISAVAAVAHVRLYAARICGLVRVVGGLNRPDASVRTLH